MSSYANKNFVESKHLRKFQFKHNQYIHIPSVVGIYNILKGNFMRIKFSTNSPLVCLPCSRLAVQCSQLSARCINATICINASRPQTMNDASRSQYHVIAFISHINAIPVTLNVQRKSFDTYDVCTYNSCSIMPVSV